MMQNGQAPLGMMAMAPPVPSYDVREIVQMVDAHEQDMQSLVSRMEADYSLYRLAPHVNTDPKTGMPLPDYAVYTSNMPRVFADKIISWLSLSELLVRAPHVEAGNHEAEADNLKERFAIGCLRAADERLSRLLQPSLRNLLSYYATVRGGYLGGRCLLAKRPDGQTYADIAAWDPMHTHWGLGPDGLAWACYKIKKTRAQIRAEYGVDPGFPAVSGDALRSTSTDAEAHGIWVYDYYDGLVNTVMTERDILKPPTPHGSPRVPAFLVLVGSAPLLQSQTASNLIAAVGESVYAGVREVYEKHNDIMSIMLEIVARSRQPTTIVESHSGTKRLPEDPNVQGTDISLRVGEKVYPMDLPRMAAETGEYMTSVSGEIQRGTLPYSSYGETPFQLSGFAITQLRQATETVLSGRVEALTNAYGQIVNLLADQFMTGSFEAMRLSGMDSHRAYFNMTITPEQMHNTCDYTTKIISQLPQDDMSKWSTAKMAKDARLLSDVDILDNILGIQDAQQAIDKLRDEQARQGLPEAVLYTMMMAAARRGDTAIARMYLMEYDRLMAVKMGIMPDMTGGSGGPTVDGQPAASPSQGAAPQVQPNAMTGAPPQPETSNDGPSRVAPRTPRPRARGQKA